MLFLDTTEADALAARLLDDAERCDHYGQQATVLTLYAHLDGGVRHHLELLADRLRVEAFTIRTRAAELESCRPVIDVDHQEAAAAARYFNTLGAVGTGALLTGLSGPPVGGMQHRVDSVSAALAMATFSTDPPLAFDGAAFVEANGPAAMALLSSGVFERTFIADATAAILRSTHDSVPGTPPGWILALEQRDIRAIALRASLRSDAADELLARLEGDVAALVHPRSDYLDDGYAAGEVLAHLGVSDNHTVFAEAVHALGDDSVQEGVAHGAAVMLAPHLPLLVDRHAYQPHTGEPGLAPDVAIGAFGHDLDEVLDRALATIYDHDDAGGPLTELAYQAAYLDLANAVRPIGTADQDAVIQLGSDWGSIIGRLERAEFDDAVDDAVALDTRNARIAQAVTLTIGTVTALGTVGAAPAVVTVGGVVRGKVRGYVEGRLRAEALSTLLPTGNHVQVLEDKIAQQADIPLRTTAFAIEVLALEGLVTVDAAFLGEDGHLRLDLDEAERTLLYQSIEVQDGWQRHGPTLNAQLSGFGNAALAEGVSRPE